MHVFVLAEDGVDDDGDDEAMMRGGAVGIGQPQVSGDQVTAEGALPFSSSQTNALHDLQNTRATEFQGLLTSRMS